MFLTDSDWCPAADTLQPFVKRSRSSRTYFFPFEVIAYLLFLKITIKETNKKITNCMFYFTVIIR